MRIRPRRLLSAGHRSDTHHFCSDAIGQNSVLLFLKKEMHISFCPQVMWDLSSLTRDRTHTLFIGNVAS